MDIQIPHQYYKSGKIASEIREAIRLKNFVGNTVLEVCELVENMIKNKGGDPAFPCNVCINDVTAHYSAKIDDSLVINDRDLVKIDLGVHIDGFIADTAVTISNNPEFESIIRANEIVLQDAIKVAKVGTKVSDIGEAISSSARRMGFQPISNLSGHSLDQYQIHSGTSIPNVWLSGNESLKANQPYAIEPFLTTLDGSGTVVEGKNVTIFSLNARRRIGDSRLDSIIDEIWNRRRTLPFTPRWFQDIINKKDVEEVFKKLVKKRVVRSYPVLIESKGRRTSQFEHTMVSSENGGIILT
jgi:methionyl aminopeptidase